MSFFNGHIITAPEASSSFHPLFRLLDDFDQYSRGADVSTSTTARGSGGARQHLKMFTPKFDVTEIVDAYELHGELPGIEQKDVEIEFTDSQTLNVKGRTERSYASTSTSTPGNAVEGAAKTAGAIEEAKKNGHHRATVEDEEQQGEKGQQSSTAVAKTDGKHQQQQHHHHGHGHEGDGTRWWVSERSVGDFSRSFTFPVRVDQDTVKASMKNGVLSIVVPKAKRAEGRKIQIS